MPTTRKSGKPEMLSRDVEIRASSLTVRIRAVHVKGDDPEIESQPWLQLKGVLTEPVKGIRDVVISLYPKDKLEVGTAGPASCGAIISARPELQFHSAAARVRPRHADLIEGRFREQDVDPLAVRIRS